MPVIKFISMTYGHFQMNEVDTEGELKYSSRT